jgi:hypothetical protein
MKIIAILIALLLPYQLQAACRCACVNGKIRNLCSSPIDIAQPCMGICPIVAPSIAPIYTPRIPPVGAHSCRNVQVYNRNLRTYQWQNICQ